MSLFYKILNSVFCIWIIITQYTQYGGGKKINQSNFDLDTNIILVYNPDPFYNLDEQVCNSFKTGLANHGLIAQITTVDNFKVEDNYDFYLFCANTYNWAPDWKTTKLIKSINLENAKVATIVLGGGSTKRAKRKLEELLKNKSANILGSKEIWLLKPNDETNPNGDNIEIGNKVALSFGTKIGALLNNKNYSYEK